MKFTILLEQPLLFKMLKKVKITIKHFSLYFICILVALKLYCIELIPVPEILTPNNQCDDPSAASKIAIQKSTVWCGITYIV